MAPRKTPGKRGSTPPADQTPQRRKRKNSGEKTGSPALVPQPHGGALRTGGNPGNKGGTGRPRSVIRAGLLVDFDERTDFLRKVIDGDLVTHLQVPLLNVLPHVECAGELKDGKCSGKIKPKDPADLLLVNFRAAASATVKDRLTAHDNLGRYALGQLKGVLQDQVEENVRKTLDVLKARLTPEQFELVKNELRPIWAGH